MRLQIIAELDGLVDLLGGHVQNFTFAKEIFSQKN
jgi:hypothetical protein